LFNLRLDLHQHWLLIPVVVEKKAVAVEPEKTAAGAPGWVQQAGEF